MPPSRASFLRRAFPWAVVAGAILAFGWFDVRHRADLEPKTEDAWRETLAPPATPDPTLKRHHSDFTVYLGAAVALKTGRDPYEAKSPRGWRYVYPPLLPVLLEPLTALRAPSAALVFYLISALALVFSGIWMARAIGPAGGARATALALLLAGPFLWQTLERGQVTILLLAAQVGAMVLLLRRRDFLAGIVLAFAVALRLTPLLPAGVVVIACIMRWKSEGVGAVWRFPAGLAAGLAFWFVAVPAAALGPSKALDVSERWVEATRHIYVAAPGASTDLAGDDYAITEYSFKNQSVRRVADVWFRPDGVLPDGSWDPARLWDASLVRNLGTWSHAPAERIEWVVAFFVMAVMVLVGLGGMGKRQASGFRRTYALAMLAPLFVTRYAWPAHFVVAAPFLAECLAPPRSTGRRVAAGVFGFAILLFYLGHLDGPLRIYPWYGVLFWGAFAAAGLYVLTPEGPTLPWRERRSVLTSYPGGIGRLYRSLRLSCAGFVSVADHLPTKGLVVDLGAGEGLFAHVLARRSPGLRVLAVDHHAPRVENIRHSALGMPTIEAVCAPMQSYVLPPCEGVALVDVMHYLDAATQEGLLRHAFDALVPGGTLVLRDPDAGAGLRFLANRAWERWATTVKLTRANIGNYRSVADWTACLEAIGFESVEPVPGDCLAITADRMLIARKRGSLS